MQEELPPLNNSQSFRFQIAQSADGLQHGAIIKVFTLEGEIVQDMEIFYGARDCYRYKTFEEVKIALTRCTTRSQLDDLFNMNTVIPYISFANGIIYSDEYQEETDIRKLKFPLKLTLNNLESNQEISFAVDGKQYWELIDNLYTNTAVEDILSLLREMDVEIEEG